MWRRSRRPSVSSSIHSRRRGHSRSSASWATSTFPSDTVTRRLSASVASTSATSSLRSRSSSASGARRRTGASPLALADQAQHDGAHELPALVGDAGVGALGQSRDGPVNAAGLAVGSQGERALSSRFCQSSRRAVDSNGSAPGSPSTSSTSASASSGSTRSPTRPAGSSTARRSSDACMGPTSTWFPPSSSASPG